MNDMPIGENETSDDAYDRKHGSQTPDKPNINPNDEWGENLNPVRETPSPFKNTGSVGK